MPTVVFFALSFSVTTCVPKSIPDVEVATREPGREVPEAHEPSKAAAMIPITAAERRRLTNRTRTLKGSRRWAGFAGRAGSSLLRWH